MKDKINVKPPFKGGKHYNRKADRFVIILKINRKG